MRFRRFFFLLQESECLQSCKVLQSCEDAVGGEVSRARVHRAWPRLWTPHFYYYISVSVCFQVKSSLNRGRRRTSRLFEHKTRVCKVKVGEVGFSLPRGAGGRGLCQAPADLQGNAGPRGFSVDFKLSSCASGRRWLMGGRGRELGWGPDRCTRL